MSVALSRMLKAAPEAIDRGMARRDQETARQREEQQYQQGQEDREYALGRRGTEDQREDERYSQGQEDRKYSLTRRAIDDARKDKQYKLAEDKQARMKSGNDALRSWMSTGDVQAINGFLNQHTTDGVDHELIKNPDGTYTGKISRDGKPAFTKTVSEDEIGSYVQMVMAQDPYAQLASQEKGKQGAKLKRQEREHELNKMKLEYQLKRGVEAVKAGAKGGANAKVPDVETKLKKDAATIYGGTLDGNNWTFETSSAEVKWLAHSALALANTYSGMDTVNANREALRDMREIESAARQAVDSELDAGTIDDDAYDDRLTDVINEYADIVLSKKSAEAKQAPVTAAPKNPDDTRPGRANWDAYLEKAMEIGKKRGMTDEQIEAAARKQYENRYGPVDMVAKPEKATEADEFKLVRDVGASEKATMSKDKAPELDRKSQNRAKSLIEKVERLISKSDVSKSMARAQLNRLKDIEDAGTWNYRLRELRGKLESIAK